MVGTVEVAAWAGFAASCASAEPTKTPLHTIAKPAKNTFRIASNPRLFKKACSGFSIPDEKCDEQYDTDNGKSQVDMPSMQLRCRHNRPQSRQRQQKGSFALREFFLFDHSRSTRLPRRPLCVQAKHFPGLKFSLTRGSGRQSAPRDDTRVQRNVQRFGNGSPPPARVPQCTFCPSPPRLAFESSPPQWPRSGQKPSAPRPYAADSGP